MAQTAATAGPVEGVERPRTRERKMRQLGIPAPEAHQRADTRKGYWRIARSWALHCTLPNAYWDQQGC